MASVEEYINLLVSKAQTVPVTECFYIGMFDDDLYYLEQALDEEGKNGELYTAIEREYRRWLDEMTAEQLAVLRAFNDGQNGANKNWFLDEPLSAYPL